RVLQVLVHGAHVLADPGTDVRVGGNRGASLELAIFLGQLVRGADERARQLALHYRLYPGLVSGVDVAVQQHDGNRVDAISLQPIAYREHARLVEGYVHRALRGHALAHFEAQGARHQRDVLPEVEVVGIRAVDAPDLVDVAESLGGNQGGLRAAALEQSVDGD